MSLRTTQRYQRLEANNIASFEDGLNGALDSLEQQGLAGIIGEPDVTIILKHNGTAIGSDKLVDAIIYIGATDEEIITDLQTPRS